MLTKPTVCLLLLLTPVAAYTQEKRVNGDAPAQLEVNTIVTKLDKDEIGRVEILNIPAQILTRTRITPQLLERQFSYKFTIRDLRGEAHQKRLMAATKSVVVQANPEMPDIRWGVIFYNVDDVRVGSIYFDKSGRKGAVNSTAVSFKGDLFQWLNENFSKCFD